MERKLNEQWIEELDGKRHMLKAVQSDHLCSGCAFSCTTFCRDPLMSERDIDCSKMIIIKDLGILNASGFLPIPFDVPDVYPKYPVINEYCRNIDGIPELFQVSYSHMNCHINFGIYNTKQQAIDAWNRRV